MTSYGTLNIYVDGGSRNNGAPDAVAAWGVVIYCNGQIIYRNGNYEIGATNSKMEVYSLLAGLTASSLLFNHVDKVNIYQDSSYCVNAYNSWVDGWIKNNKTERAYFEVWRHIYNLKLSLGNKVKVIKVKGHADIEGNIEVDALVNQLMDNKVDTRIDPYTLVDLNGFKPTELDSLLPSDTVVTYCQLKNGVLELGYTTGAGNSMIKVNINDFIKIIESEYKQYLEYSNV